MSLCNSVPEITSWTIICNEEKLVESLESKTQFNNEWVVYSLLDFFLSNHEIEQPIVLSFVHSFHCILFAFFLDEDHFSECALAQSTNWFKVSNSNTLLDMFALSSCHIDLLEDSTHNPLVALYYVFVSVIFSDIKWSFIVTIKSTPGCVTS